MKLYVNRTLEKLITTVKVTIVTMMMLTIITIMTKTIMIMMMMTTMILKKDGIFEGQSCMK